MLYSLYNACMEMDRDNNNSLTFVGCNGHTRRQTDTGEEIDRMQLVTATQHPLYQCIMFII